MINVNKSCMFLHTCNTTYAFGVMDSGHLEHYYYGRRISGNDSVGIREQQAFVCGNGIAYCDKYPEICLEDQALEVSGYGVGDIREPFVEMQYSDGSFTNDFIYHSYRIEKGKKALLKLPSATGTKENCEQLVVTMKERYHDMFLDLTYSVYYDTDVIVKSAMLRNETKATTLITRLMSNQLDFCEGDYSLHTFNGSWASEMHKSETVLQGARVVNSSFAGTSSNRANPFVMLADCETTEEYGDCYGLNLIYSGNHYTSLEKNSYGKVRLVSGINPTSFRWMLRSGATFQTPEAVLTYSDKGFSGMSANMHQFVREFIVRGKWQYKERPVLLNSWEACYFDINERKLVNLAKAGSKVGIELFVMDDGWFGHRNDDTSSLGDWVVNEKKLPGGIERLAEKINGLGMDFGIWVEPEMVNEDSQLFKDHIDWVVRNRNRSQSLGRNQMILDLTNSEVQDYIIEAMTKVFSSGNISYVKWDMNRIVSDSFSPHLGITGQGAFYHQYYLGLYHVLDTLMKQFPNILFEGCAAGGNRFDLGMLCYFPQIWGSDDTDAHERVQIQIGYSYGYPQSVISAHVSACPNHQTLRTTDLDTRFNVATYGLLGYEFNLTELSKGELETIKGQVATYKKWRKTLQFGDFYRGRTTGDVSWTVVNKEKDKAVGVTYRALAKPNHFFMNYKAKGLDARKTYHFYSVERKRSIKEFGTMVNMASPIHIKEGSVVQNVADHFMKMKGDIENGYISGDRLMYSGYKTKQAFGGTGFNELVRIYKDFSTRLYFMEEESNYSDNGELRTIDNTASYVELEEDNLESKELEEAET